MANTDPKEFYAEKGLKRTTITLRPSTVEFLGSKAKQFTKEVKIATQGDRLVCLCHSDIAFDREYTAMSLCHYV
ncbi:MULTISPECIES: hypothetical protein [Acinetobacter]|uniref:hypothetical protein n=1 Tax=Acinetobacter TaxID=469 RepID=UPI0021CD2E0F|nr:MULTISPECIES: hypothetical protein [Acinetobacter]MCU4321669.1 hypothetical protein [Acinetobacter bereziniae]MDH0720518.1 hypothetical protein [Acinetobacter junii]